MQKIIVIQNAQVGVYGVDVDGNYWCSFSLAGSGASVTCTRCGARISGGYECGMYPAALPYCAGHVQWVYPEEDDTGKGVATQPLNVETIGGRYIDPEGHAYYFCRECEKIFKGNYGRLVLDRKLYTSDTWANRHCYHCQRRLFRTYQEGGTL